MTIAFLILMIWLVSALLTKHSRIGAQTVAAMPIKGIVNPDPFAELMERGT